MNPVSYGSKGQTWHPLFVEYMTYIVNHANYNGMPDAIDPDTNKIQWEAPSNRLSGRFKDTHVNRRHWWERKATSKGISPDAPLWISQTAKLIHPSKQKPCKRCGKVLFLEYRYPQKRLLEKINLIPGLKSQFNVSEFNTITQIVQTVLEECGDDSLKILVKLLSNEKMQFDLKITKSPDDFLAWLEIFIKSEPKGCLSPGAMSNAPDRFDGFHSFNLCCRSKADTGRNADNLKLYSTDRRVFENWNEGNWIAADRLMGLIKVNFPQEKCKNGHPGPCDSDHIGPISLGFTHRAKFQLLCSTCNSAKNNRLNRHDIQILQSDLKEGQHVLSWQTKPIWNSISDKIETEKDALQASKIMRDFSYYPLEVFHLLLKNGHISFLIYLLELNYADFDVSFSGLHIANSLTVFHNMKLDPRTTKYAKIQKIRRIRIAFNSLQQFFIKDNRNFFRFKGWEADELESLVSSISVINKEASTLDQILLKLISVEKKTAEIIISEKIIDYLPTISGHQENFEKTKALITSYLEGVASSLALNWDCDRYIR